MSDYREQAYMAIGRWCQDTERSLAVDSLQDSDLAMLQKELIEALKAAAHAEKERCAKIADKAAKANARHMEQEAAISNQVMTDIFRACKEEAEGISEAIQNPKD